MKTKFKSVKRFEFRFTHILCRVMLTSVKNKANYFTTIFRLVFTRINMLQMLFNLILISNPDTYSQSDCLFDT